MIAEDARCEREIKKRIAMAKEAYNRRGELMRGSLPMNIKKRMVKTLVWSVALYGAETWTMKTRDVEKMLM